MQTKILLVEDDRGLCEIICDYFDDKGQGEVSVEAYQNGNDALCAAGAIHYDLVILDVMLPDADGFTLCREIRKKSAVPVLFLTARQAEEDALRGYALGCDDYMTKPFSCATLYAKCMALVKRSRGTVTGNLTVGAVTLDSAAHRAFALGRELRLAPKEYELLRALMENAGRALSREALVARIWGEEFEGSDRAVDSCVKKLRRALGEARGQLATVVGTGYRFNE